MAKEVVKRVPTGTRVKWQAVEGRGPIHSGIVKAFVPKGSRYPLEFPCWGRNDGGNVYVVLEDKTATGLTREEPIVMHPYAKWIDAQNPKALRVVK